MHDCHVHFTAEMGRTVLIGPGLNIERAEAAGAAARWRNPIRVEKLLRTRQRRFYGAGGTEGSVHCNLWQQDLPKPPYSEKPHGCHHMPQSQLGHVLCVYCMRVCTEPTTVKLCKK